MIKITQLFSGWLVSTQWSKLSWILPNESSGNQSLRFAFTFKGLASHLELSDQKMCSLGWNTFDFRSNRVLFFLFMFSFVCCFQLWQGCTLSKKKKKKRKKNRGWVNLKRALSCKCHLLENIWSSGSISPA